MTRGTNTHSRDVCVLPSKEEIRSLTVFSSRSRAGGWFDFRLASSRCLECFGTDRRSACALAPPSLSGRDPSGALDVGTPAGSNPHLATAGRSRPPHFTFRALLRGCSRLDQLLKIARPRTRAAWPAITRSDDLGICTDSTTQLLSRFDL